MSNLSIVIPSEVKGLFSLQKTNPQQTTTRRANSMGLDPAHRTPKRFRLFRPTQRFVIPSEARDLGFSCSQQEPRFLALLGMTIRGKIIEAGHVLRTPAGFSQALIKIYTPCNLPN